MSLVSYLQGVVKTEPEQQHSALVKALHLHEIYGNRVSGRMPTATSLNIRLPVPWNLQNSLTQIFLWESQQNTFLYWNYSH